MDELIEQGRRQFAGCAEETVVAGTGGERTEIVLQCRGVARLDKAHGHRVAAARAQHVGILPEIVETEGGHRPLLNRNGRRPPREATLAWLLPKPARTGLRLRR